jgi:hypothetical protein
MESRLLTRRRNRESRPTMRARGLAGGGRIALRAWRGGGERGDRGHRARTVVAGVTVSQGRVRRLLYQSSAEAYDPQRHDVTFLVAGAPAAGTGDSAVTTTAAAVRVTFGPPVSMYRFDGYTIDSRNVNLLTRMR